MRGDRGTAILDTSYIVRYLTDDPPDMAERATEVIERANLRLATLPKDRVLEALRLCRNSSRVSFTDALVWAQAVEMGAERIYAFDGKFPSRGVSIIGM